MNPVRCTSALPHWRRWLLVWLLPALLWAQHTGLAHRVGHAGHEVRTQQASVAPASDGLAAGVLGAHDRELCTLLDHIGTGEALVASSLAKEPSVPPAIGAGVLAFGRYAPAPAPYAARAPPRFG